MNHRSEQEPRDADNREATVQGVERREQFAGPGLDRVDWTHAAEDHRRIEQRIDPWQPLKEVVAADANRKRVHQDRCRNRTPSREPPDKKRARQQGLVAPFEAHPRDLDESTEPGRTITAPVAGLRPSWCRFSSTSSALATGTAPTDNDAGCPRFRLSASYLLIVIDGMPVTSFDVSTRDIWNSL